MGDHGKLGVFGGFHLYHVFGEISSTIGDRWLPPDRDVVFVNIDHLHGPGGARGFWEDRDAHANNARHSVIQTHTTFDVHIS